MTFGFIRSVADKIHSRCCCRCCFYTQPSDHVAKTDDTDANSNYNLTHVVLSDDQTPCTVFDVLYESQEIQGDSAHSDDPKVNTIMTRNHSKLQVPPKRQEQKHDLSSWSSSSPISPTRTWKKRNITRRQQNQEDFDKLMLESFTGSTTSISLDSTNSGCGTPCSNNSQSDISCSSFDEERLVPLTRGRIEDIIPMISDIIPSLSQNMNKPINSNRNSSSSSNDGQNINENENIDCVHDEREVDRNPNSRNNDSCKIVMASTNGEIITDNMDEIFATIYLDRSESHDINPLLHIEPADNQLSVRKNNDSCKIITASTYGEITSDNLDEIFATIYLDRSESHYINPLLDIEPADNQLGERLETIQKEEDHVSVNHFRSSKNLDPSSYHSSGSVHEADKSKTPPDTLTDDDSDNVLSLLQKLQRMESTLSLETNESGLVFISDAASTASSVYNHPKSKYSIAAPVSHVSNSNSSSTLKLRERRHYGASDDCVSRDTQDTPHTQETPQTQDTGSILQIYTDDLSTANSTIASLQHIKKQQQKGKFSYDMMIALHSLNDLIEESKKNKNITDEVINDYSDVIKYMDEMAWDDLMKQWMHDKAKNEIDVQTVTKNFAKLDQTIFRSSTYNNHDSNHVVRENRTAETNDATPESIPVQLEDSVAINISNKADNNKAIDDSQVEGEDDENKENEVEEDDDEDYDDDQYDDDDDVSSIDTVCYSSDDSES